MTGPCCLRLLFGLCLACLLVSVAPEELATGHILPPGQMASFRPSGPVPLADHGSEPVTWCWNTYSDIAADLSSEHLPTSAPPNDSGTAHRAAELGYSNRLLGMDPGGGRGTNILLLGIDTRRSGRGRSDCIMLLRIEPGVGVLTLSIPRDMKVPLSPSNPLGYQDKIAHMYVYGGVERTIRSVENLLRITIDHHVVVRNLSDFNKLVSLIRGVELDKRLEGQLALKWVRNRSFARGDLERSMRAQMFVKAAIEKTWRLTDGADGRLTGILTRAALLLVETDMSADDVLELAAELRTTGFAPSAQIYTGHVDGRPAWAYSPVLDVDLAFIEPDSEQLEHFARLFASSEEGVSSVRSE